MATCSSSEGRATSPAFCNLSADERLKAIANALDQIVVSEGEDSGVILLSADSPTRYDPDLKCQVYLHENFSPLGDALVKLAKLARG